LIIEKAVELGKALAESYEIAELREAEAEYGLDSQAKKMTIKHLQAAAADAEGVPRTAKAVFVFHRVQAQANFS